MPLVKAYDEVENPRIQRNLPNGHFGWRTDFIKRPEDKSIDTPMAFLAEGSAHRVLRTHFHTVDQYQVMYNGSGALGKTPVGRGAVHFSRAYTPYGPISLQRQGPGLHHVARASRSRRAIPAREPRGAGAGGQSHAVAGYGSARLRSRARRARRGDESAGGLERAHDGLAGWSVKMNAGAKAYAPDSSKGDGQYILVMKGGIVQEGKLRKDLTVVWVGRNEGPFELVAGPEGMEGLILNFPVPGGGMPEEAKAVAADGQRRVQDLAVHPVRLRVRRGGRPAGGRHRARNALGGRAGNFRLPRLLGQEGRFRDDRALETSSCAAHSAGADPVETCKPRRRSWRSTSMPARTSSPARPTAWWAITAKCCLPSRSA